ncbi:uncharacterized protein LOC143893712 [Temnothorax americanus]|uniref:uncharacterized protein LOC143893712 n=1 Tax=Temnothorax americanus TaxID=1964332 RepID=UPI0040677C27
MNLENIARNITNNILKIYLFKTNKFDKHTLSSTNSNSEVNQIFLTYFIYQIDYIILDTRWKTSVTNVKTFPGADCGSDHNLLVANFSIRLKVFRSNPPQKPGRLESPERSLFKGIVETKLKESPPPEDADAKTRWGLLKGHICDTLDHMTKNRSTGSRKKSWITDRTWELIQLRKDIKMKGLKDPQTMAEYTAFCKIIKKCCRQDKNNFIEGICGDIENHSHRLQTSDLFKKVRVLSKQFKSKSWVIEDADGNPLHELDKIAERWRCYCEQLYKNPRNSFDRQPEWSGIDKEPSILRSKITEALRSLKDKKAPGPDQITAEVLKALGETGIDTLHAICNHIWQHGEWPQDWTESVILPLHKKGSTKRCDNYRTLSLISHASKILLYIINNRIRHFLDWQIPQEQAGFVRGRGTREQILNIRQVIEKSYEFDTPVIMCFVDYCKAFDCVDWRCLWGILTKLGVPQHLTALLCTLYYSSRRVVRVDKTTSGPFSFGKGVRQGCILSPILFNVYGEYIMRRTCEKWEGGVTIGGVKITNLRYADDTTLLAATEAEMVALLSRMEEVSNEMGLTINRSKTKIMVVDRFNKLELTGVHSLEVVESFNYLGSTISNNGSCEAEIRKRIGMAKNAMSQLHGIWAAKNISVKTKARLVRTLVFSIFAYGAETWTLRANDRKRIDAFEMWCWRRMLRIPWTAHRTNASILRELGITARLSTICLRRILEYFGHIARRSGDNLEKLMVTGKMEGKRPRGRSPTRWADQIRTTLDTTMHEALHTAQDRVSWRNVVRRKIIPGRGHDPQH